MRKRSREHAEKFKGIYEVTLSSDPSAVKKVIMDLAYKLHMGYEDGKARLSESPQVPDKLVNDLTEKTPQEIEGFKELKNKQNSLNINSINEVGDLLVQYGGAYDDIQSAVAAARIDSNHFIFQLPDRTMDQAKQATAKEMSIKGAMLYCTEMFMLTEDDPKFQEKEAQLHEEFSSVALKERDYVLVTLGDKEASQEAPSDWYDQELGGHLIVGGPAVAPKSTNISNGTPSTGRNNNTKEEMEAERKEEKNKG